MGFVDFDEKHNITLWEKEKGTGKGRCKRQTCLGRVLVLVLRRPRYFSVFYSVVDF